MTAVACNQDNMSNVTPIPFSFKVAASTPA
jgi:hypothetical protein